MSTIITKGLLISVPQFDVKDVLVTSRRDMQSVVKRSCKAVGLDTARDAVKALNTLDAKIKAAGLIWEDRTPKKTAKRASRASRRRYEHHARNELMNNLEKSSGAPRGGEAIEITLAKDLKDTTRKAAKARRVARKIKSQVESAVKKSFTSPADKADSLVKDREAKIVKSEKIEVPENLEEKVADCILFGLKPIIFAWLTVTLTNGESYTIKSQVECALAPVVASAVRDLVEAKRKAKAKRKAERETEAKPLTKAAFLRSTDGSKKQAIKAERTAKAQDRRRRFKANGGAKVGGPGEGVQVHNQNLDLCAAGHIGTKVAA